MAAGGLVPASAVDIQTCPAVQSRRGCGRRGCIFYASHVWTGMRASACRRQGLPDCHGAGASVRRCMPDGSVIRTAKLIAGHAAEGERWELRPGRSGCRRCLDLDPGPQMDTSPGSSSGPEPGRRPCPGMPRRNRLPQPRPPGRRPMRSPGSSIFLFRYHAERRGRAEENARGPAVRRGLVGRVASSGKDADGTFRAVRVAPPALRELDQVNYLRSCWPWPERPSGSVGGPLGLAACRLMWCQTRATPGAER